MMALGLILAGATFAGWYALNAFACGMKPTGCGRVTLQWHDWEALQLFVPSFVAGVVIFAYGLWRHLRRRPARRRAPQREAP